MKLVLAAAMWNNPHLLVLDEPTNYLDRESLGALASAINNFQGAVIMISHNSGALRLPPACQNWLHSLLLQRPVLQCLAFESLAALCYVSAAQMRQVAHIKLLPWPCACWQITP